MAKRVLVAGDLVRTPSGYHGTILSVVDGIAYVRRFGLPFPLPYDLYELKRV